MVYSKGFSLLFLFYYLLFFSVLLFSFFNFLIRYIRYTLILYTSLFSFNVLHFLFYFRPIRHYFLVLSLLLSFLRRRVRHIYIFQWSLLFFLRFWPFFSFLSRLTKIWMRQNDTLRRKRPKRLKLWGVVKRGGPQLLLFCLFGSVKIPLFFLVWLFFVLFQLFNMFFFIYLIFTVFSQSNIIKESGEEQSFWVESSRTSNLK